MKEHPQDSAYSSETGSTTEPLLIPPSLLVDQDVSFGSTKLRTSLQNLGHCVIHVGDKGLADKSDTTIAQEALVSDAAVITSDKSFLKTVVTQGGNCPDSIIVVPKMKKLPEVSDTLTSLAEIIDTVSRSLTIPGYKSITRVDQDQGDFVAYKLQVPAEVLQLVPVLEARGEIGLSARELALRCERSTSTARRRAEKWVKEGWLRKERRGRNVFYAKSWLLEQVLGSLQLERTMGAQEGSDVVSHVNPPPAGGSRGAPSRGESQLDQPC